MAGAEPGAHERCAVQVWDGHRKRRGMLDLGWRSLSFRVLEGRAEGDEVFSLPIATIRRVAWAPRSRIDWPWGDMKITAATGADYLVEFPAPEVGDGGGFVVGTEHSLLVERWRRLLPPSPATEPAAEPRRRPEPWPARIRQWWRQIIGVG